MASPTSFLFVNRQSVGQIMDSKGNLISYCNEVQKKLGMEYRAPPLPIDLKSSQLVGSFIDSLSQDGQLSRGSNAELDEDAQFEQFRLMAQNQHNIRFS
jgi:hypothetical protein